MQSIFAVESASLGSVYQIKGSDFNANKNTPENKVRNYIRRFMCKSPYVTHAYLTDTDNVNQSNILLGVRGTFKAL